MTWEDLHHAWWNHLPSGHDVAAFPLTASKIAGVGCLLKAGGYRSGHNYISAAKDRHLSLVYPWDEVLAHAYRRFTLSVQRGVGPPKQSEPLRFKELQLMNFPVDPQVAGGPINTAGVITMYTYWLLRDVEGGLSQVHGPDHWRR